MDNCSKAAAPFETLTTLNPSAVSSSSNNSRLEAWSSATKIVPVTGWFELQNIEYSLDKKFRKSVTGDKATSNYGSHSSRFLFGFRNKNGVQHVEAPEKDLLPSSLTKRRREQGHIVSGVWVAQLTTGLHLR